MTETTRLELYPFAYFDAITRKWRRGRYVASIEDIGRRYGPFKITGEPEIRNVPINEAERLPTRPR